jgi:hypothetical protein
VAVRDLLGAHGYIVAQRGGCWPGVKKFVSLGFMNLPPMKTLLLSVMLFSICTLYAQEKVTPAPEAKDGNGPYPQLIIRGVMLVDGTGAPPIGPTDIVIRQNKIVAIQTVGYPGVAINAEKRPKLETGGVELNCEGMYLLPGFIDMHGHIGGSQAPNAEYVFKLWMGHGITTIRDPSAGNGLDWVQGGSDVHGALVRFARSAFHGPSNTGLSP